MNEADDVIKMLDNLTQSGDSRIAITMTAQETADSPASAGSRWKPRRRLPREIEKRRITTAVAMWAAPLQQGSCLTRRSRTAADNMYFMPIISNRN